ncbi:DinB family protein [Subtercola sp. YIM 133946]|uniref:DinB family protein n=1 Tax=Subtercola sp. YIM 133946 TaxID=3118909 RepID=UPI002F92BF1E
MTTDQRLEPLLEQYDWATERLLSRLAGPTSNSGDGSDVEVPALTDAEYLWEPVAGCWSVRRRDAGPGQGATKLIGAGEWGRDGAPETPWPPPVTTIAWRLDHLTESLLGRASHLGGDRMFDRTAYEAEPEAAGAVDRFRAAVAGWRRVLLSVDEADYDRTGLSSYPYGSDAEETFPTIVWWENQEILHHGAEIALLRDLYVHLAR